MDLKLTMIMPVYNTPKHLLNRSVISVLKQSYSNIELIIIDDCSTAKDTIEYLQKLDEKSLSNIVILRNNKNCGVSKSRNIAIQYADSDFIGFIDHDDYIKPNFAEAMMKSVENEKIDMVICGKEIVDDNNIIINKTKFEEYSKPTFPYFSSMVWTRIYRRKVLIDKNIFFPDGCYCEDSIFTLNCTEKISNYVINKMELYVHYDNSVSAGRSKSFYAQPIKQIPFDYLEQIASLMYNKQFAPGNIWEQITMMSIIILAGSDEDTKRMAIEKSLKIIKRIWPYQKNIRKYILKTPNQKLFKILSIGQLWAYKLNFFPTYCKLASIIIKKHFRL